MWNPFKLTKEEEVQKLIIDHILAEIEYDQFTKDKVCEYEWTIETKWGQLHRNYFYDTVLLKNDGIFVKMSKRMKRYLKKNFIKAIKIKNKKLSENAINKMIKKINEG